MQLSEIRTEVANRGFDYVSASRLNAWINSVITDINERQDWPWLETTTTGTAPLAIADLRQTIYVVDTTNKNRLNPMDVRDIVSTIDVDVTTTGTPQFYWLDNQTLRTYPVSTTASLSVRYYKVPADLSLDADTPTIPTRYHELIVDGTVLEGFKDSDNLAEAESEGKTYEENLQQMTRNLLKRTYDDPEYIQSSHAGYWSSW